MVKYHRSSKLAGTDDDMKMTVVRAGHHTYRVIHHSTLLMGIESFCKISRNRHVCNYVYVAIVSS